MSKTSLWTHFRKTWKPECYHGSGSAPYFEGWYYKIIDKSLQRRMAIIPGISFQEEDSHAFIQILDDTTQRAHYIRYPVHDFHAEADRFVVRIGDSEFQDHSFRLAIQSPDISLKGELYLINRFPWPVSLFSPGAMGWYGLVPLMQCYHGILSMNHEIQGDLILDQERISFSDGKGYTEKDWGTAFPEGYIWMQCNHFQDTTLSVSCSIARIPWVTGTFRGLLAGLVWQNRLYKFTTYSGAEVESMKLTADSFQISLRDKNHILRLEATSSRTSDLRAPDGKSMGQRASQAMNGTMELELRTVAGEMLVRSRGSCVAMETGGETGLILSDPK